MTYQRTVGEARSGFTFRHSEGRGLTPPYLRKVVDYNCGRSAEGFPRPERVITIIEAGSNVLAATARLINILRHPRTSSEGHIWLKIWNIGDNHRLEPSQIKFL